MLKAILVMLLLPVVFIAEAAPSQVIVVRHAEKALEPKADPSLSDEGKARAAVLADMLSDANIGTIITTDYQRTKETAMVLANRLGIPLTVIGVNREGLPNHIKDVTGTINKASGVVLVVGHSNTVPEIVAAFSSTKPVKLCETSYSNMFIVTPSAASLPAINLKFGKPDALATTECQ